MTKEQIRELRITMQALLDNYWNMFEKSRETAMAYTELQYARMWMGKLLGEMGEEHPYPKDGDRKTASDIEPTADTNPRAMFQLSGSQIEKADQLREWVKPYTSLGDWYIEKTAGMLTPHSCIHNIWTHLSNARMALGLYLAELRVKV